jgi:hypothetical protein
MKTKLLFPLFILLMIQMNHLLAQEEKPMQYLLSGQHLKISGFGAPIVEFSSINNEFAVSVGGGGAAIFNQTFFIGGYGEGLSTGHYLYNLASEVNIDQPRISFGHGGFWLGYLYKANKAVHGAFSLKLGWGQISLYDNTYTYDPMDYKARDGVFVVTPQLEMELNLTTWFKVNIGAGYRLVTGVDKTYLNDQGMRVKYYNTADFSSPVGSLTFMFGYFKK